eukprot:Pompholyxophrys_punicea_v1_NODE_257_length_2508_cov_3.165919.p2 type:complete len:203 gc:universal NODE_257_length_2508_cov_3.165919:2036-1428(-)
MADILKENPPDQASESPAPSPEKSVEIPKSVEILKPGSEGYDDAYAKAYKWAGEQRRAGRSLRKTAQLAQKTFNVQIGKHAVDSAAKSNTAPRKPGPERKYPVEAEDKLVQFIEELRALNLPTYKSVIMKFADKLISGTPFQAHYPKGVTDHWYQRFLKSNPKLFRGKQVPLEAQRAKWASSANIEKHYNVLRDTLLETNLL